MNPAKMSRLQKERHPELYCSKCLWRTGGGDCPRHKKVTVETLGELKCVDCGSPQSECEAKCPRGIGGIHTFAEFAL